MFSMYADRRFVRLESDKIEPGMVYTIHMLPDPKEELWKHLLQVFMHTLTGKGGRRATVTTLDGMMWHGYKSSTGLFTSRPIKRVPLGAKLKSQGACMKIRLKVSGTATGSVLTYFLGIAGGRYEQYTHARFRRGYANRRT